MPENEIIPVEDVGQPITIAFSKSGRMFFSERLTGRLWEASLNFQDTVKETPQKTRLITTFPTAQIIGHNEAGFIGIALDPDFEMNGYIYCYYTYGNPNTEEFGNRVVRVKEDGTGEETILDHIPAGIIHNGGILTFGQDKTLYIGVGVNNFQKEKAQDLSFLGGKIVRINPDGSIPSDNPFPNSPVYSYGHRNVFGLAVHPKTGKIYESEVGPDDNDEINIIEKGGNYGWPETKGISDNSKYINPIKTYTPTITPTQSVFVGGDLYFSSYNEGTVHKLTLSGENYDEVEKDDVIYKDQPFGIVGVFYGPDNYFYITTTTGISKFKVKDNKA